VAPTINLYVFDEENSIVAIAAPPPPPTPPEAAPEPPPAPQIFTLPVNVATGVMFQVPAVLSARVPSASKSHELFPSIGGSTLNLIERP
jgi:hypothetical protein